MLKDIESRDRQLSEPLMYMGGRRKRRSTTNLKDKIKLGAIVDPLQ